MILMMVMVFPMCTFGQVLNAGFRGGLNTNRFITTTSGFGSSEPSIGLTGGVFLRVKGVRFSFQPEMLLSHKTGLIPFGMTAGNSDTLLRASLQQLDIPLIINLHLGRVVRFGTGPVIGYGLGEKVTLNTKGSNYTLVIDKGVFKPTSYSWQFGCALEFRRVFFDARYELGIDKLNYEIPMPGEPIVFDPVIHNRTWQFTIGYKFVKRKN